MRKSAVYARPWETLDRTKGTKEEMNSFLGQKRGKAEQVEGRRISK